MKQEWLDDVVAGGWGLLMCRNPDGTIAWTRQFKNGVTNAGLDYLGGAAFSAFAQITTWYAGLIDFNSFTTGLAATDTMSSHPGWKENTQYSGNRAIWANTENGQQVSSNGPFAFNITGNGTIHGLFITSNPTPGQNSGTLWATAVLSSDAIISVGQTLTGTYSVSFSGA